MRPRLAIETDAINRPMQPLIPPYTLFFAALLALISMSCKPQATPIRDARELLGKPAPSLANETVGAVEHSDERCTLRVLWATWCDPCREELPQLPAWNARLEEPLNIELVDVDGASRTKLTRFLDTHEIPYGTYFNQSLVATRHGARAIPIAYLIDRRGIIVDVHPGSLTFATLRAMVADSSCASSAP